MKAIAELRVSLQDSKPRIYRRIAVPHEITLHDLHLVIQAAMGWENNHAYLFKIDQTTYMAPKDPDVENCRDSRRAKLSSLPEEISFFDYLYDLGDGWEHEIEILSVRKRKAGDRAPFVLSGKNACPPEDCGGISGYENILELLDDEDSSDRRELIKWQGTDWWDYSKFSLKTANDRVESRRLRKD